MKNILKIVVIPILLMLICLTAGMPFYVNAGRINLVALYVVIGFPFGMGKMFITHIPTNISKLLYDILVGGIIGGIIAFKKIIYAFYFLMIVLILRREEKIYENNNM